jgi:hypothetical protein
MDMTLDMNQEHSVRHRRKSVFFDDKALREDNTKVAFDHRVETLAQCYQTILQGVGEDSTREGEY